MIAICVAKSSLQRLPCPAQAPAGIELWQVNLDLAQADSECDWSCLDGDELVRARGFYRREDQIRFAEMRVVLRSLLAQRLNSHPRNLQFTQNAFGKPRLRDPLGMEFNQAHAGEFGLLALSEGAVGVDIEYCTLAPGNGEIADIAAQMLSERELLQQPQGMSDDVFFMRWVVKEAVLKALGIGIGEHLRDLSVFAAADGAYALHHDQRAWPALHAHRLDPPAGYVAALAWIDPDQR